MLVSLNMTSITGTLHAADRYRFFLTYLDELFLQWEMFQTKIVEKIKTHILCSVTFFPKIVPLWDNAEKYGRTRKATEDNIIWRTRFACWINKATDTHSECVTFIAFPRKHQRHRYLCTYVVCLVGFYFGAKKGVTAKWDISVNLIYTQQHTYARTHARSHRCARSLSSEFVCVHSNCPTQSQNNEAHPLFTAQSQLLD